MAQRHRDAYCSGSPASPPTLVVHTSPVGYQVQNLAAPVDGRGIHGPSEPCRGMVAQATESDHRDAVDLSEDDDTLDRVRQSRGMVPGQANSRPGVHGGEERA